MANFFEHPDVNKKRNYLRILIALACSDGVFDLEEKILIKTIGIRRGLTEGQVNELLEESSEHELFVPDASNRMNLLYDAMQVVYADGKVTEGEVAFVTNIISALELEPQIVQDLIGLFATSTPDTAQWNEFIEDVVEDDSKKFVTIL